MSYLKIVNNISPINGKITNSWIALVFYQPPSRNQLVIYLEINLNIVNNILINKDILKNNKTYY